MKKNSMINIARLGIFILYGLGIAQVSWTEVAFAAPSNPCLGPAIIWHNLNDCTDPANRLNGPADDVIDNNIDIIGTNVITGPLHVTAQTCDITITVTNSDSILAGCDNTARFYLVAYTGRTITFKLTANLLFRGSPTNDDLLISVEGGGTVIFAIEGGESLTFESDALGTGGARLFVRMGAGRGASGSNPTLEFMRLQPFGADINSDVNIIVGPQSSIGFMGTTSTDTATIIFDASNSPSGTGRTVLQLNDGTFLVRGVFVPSAAGLPDPTLSNINLDTNVGLPVLIIDNPNTGIGAFSSLQVVNNNTECPAIFFDPFCQDNFNGVQTGFVLGPVGTLIINDMTYLDYIGTATNVCCTFTIQDVCTTTSVQRLRNGSALIIDGLPDNSTTFTIRFNGDSAIYFRSGVDACGAVNTYTSGIPFVIDPKKKTPCQGNIVFDVEGRLDVIGSPNGEHALNILSLAVDPTGCPVFVEGTSTAFPKRTFARDANGDYFRYNSGAFLINNRVNITNAALVHTDVNHDVFEENNLGRVDLNSEPSYVGGDSNLLLCKQGILQRPTIAFYNGEFRINTDVALTGVDLLVTNTLTDNESRFIFYQNGRCIDKGYGRNLILGVDQCLQLCSTTTDGAAHINVFQENSGPATNITLRLLTAPNSSCITEGIVSSTAIANQFEMHSIYLNNATNISIGTNGAMGMAGGTTFNVTSTALFLIDSSWFGFMTRGGTLGYPEASGTTGEGGIFVDQNGIIRTSDGIIASFSAMVVKSRNGIIDLPLNSVFFTSRVGITEWMINLNDPTQRVLVAPGTSVSDYTIDWGAVIKDCIDFVPYDLPSTPLPCNFPPVTSANLTALPVIQGSVEQLQIKRSRIGDQVHLIVDGGNVEELIFLSGYNTAEAPVGFIVARNDARIGLGTAHRNVDSLQASIVLGVNGVMLIADGNGTFILNENIEINNVCHILSGTSFGVTSTQTLTIFSTTEKEFRVKSTGVLDLTAFDTPGKQLAFAGEVKVVFEPGARILMNGGTIIFTDNTQFYLDLVTNHNRPIGTTVQSTDDIRVRLSGLGNIIMNENSEMIVHRDTYFGVETNPTCTVNTNITWRLFDDALILIGDESFPGGTFQIGDTNPTNTGTIGFSMIIDGIGAKLQVGSQGFLGFGAGIVDKPQNVPNLWTIGCLSNVATLTINIVEGTFSDNKIASGDEAIASLFVIGPATSYTFLFDTIASNILGGANLFTTDCQGAVSFTPTVTTFSGITSAAAPFTQTGILAGKFLLIDKVGQPAGVSRQQLFNYLQTTNYTLQPNKRANFASNLLNTGVMGFVDISNTIQRPILNAGFVFGLDGLSRVSYEHSLIIGAVDMTLNVDSNTVDVSLNHEIIGNGSK